jgi:hypothetical protein
MIEIFDSHTVSFVSVTQQFNTTTSMGRLTLNVLLSFAQFEREITGERIRDKVAASKKKGMWMGGVAPLGYDCADRRLILNQAEANTVRAIFRQYQRLGCVKKLKDFLDRNQIHSKVRTSRAGRACGGAAYSRGALYHLLNNRIYLGEIVHRGQSYPGQHRPIVPRELWNKVAARLHSNNQAHRTGKSHSTPSLLGGRLFDGKGATRFTPTHTVKNAKRYRYYTSQTVILQACTGSVITRFPAQELERFVKSQIHLLLQAPERCTAGMENSPSKDAAAERAQGLAREWPKLEISKQHEFTRNILKWVVLGQSTVRIEIDKTKLLRTLLAEDPEGLASLRTHKSDILKLTSNFQVLRRGNELRLSTAQNGSCFEAAPVSSFVKAIARARNWYERIVAGEVNTIGQLARESGLTKRYVRRILQCATLSPQITEALLTGKHRSNLTLKEILHRMPLNWREQEERTPSVIVRRSS